MENDFETHRPLEGKIKKVTLYSRKKRSTIFEQILELNDEKATIEIVNHNPPGMGDEYLFPNPAFDGVMGDLKDVYETFFEKSSRDDWKLVFVNEAGEEFETHGALQKSGRLSSISDMIRSMFKRDDLLVFDGNPDKVDRIELLFNRCLNFSDEEIVDSSERIVIERASESIVVQRNTFDRLKVRSNVQLAGIVSNFLDDVSVNAFSRVEGNPADVCENPAGEQNYLIRLETKFGRKKEVKGSFDKRGLPVDGPKFAEKLNYLLYYYGVAGEILNPFNYEKVLRCKDELIFCNVCFDDSGSAIMCLADEDQYEFGDCVYVEGIDEIGQIESVEYHKKEDAPVSLQKVRHILGKCDDF